MSIDKIIQEELVGDLEEAIHNLNMKIQKCSEVGINCTIGISNNSGDKFESLKTFNISTTTNLKILRAELSINLLKNK